MNSEGPRPGPPAAQSTRPLRPAGNLGCTARSSLRSCSPQLSVTAPLRVLRAAAQPGPRSAWGSDSISEGLDALRFTFSNHQPGRVPARVSRTVGVASWLLSPPTPPSALPHSPPPHPPPTPPHSHPGHLTAPPTPTLPHSYRKVLIQKPASLVLPSLGRVLAPG